MERLSFVIEGRKIKTEEWTLTWKTEIDRRTKKTELFQCFDIRIIKEQKT